MRLLAAINVGVEWCPLAFSPLPKYWLHPLHKEQIRDYLGGFARFFPLWGSLAGLPSKKLLIKVAVNPPL